MYIGNSPFTKASYNSVEVLATEGQTTFNVSYNPNFVEVLVNGVELSKADYVAVNGTSVVLNEPLVLNDVVLFKVWGTFLLPVDTKASALAKGTTAERPATVEAGYAYLRYNSEFAQWEGSPDGITWAGLGGATGGAGNPWVYEHEAVVTEDYTIKAGKRAITHDITIADGITVIIEDGASLVVV